MNTDSPIPDDMNGVVLAAAPTMIDPNFNQTLIYIAKHDPGGAFGLVMNRPAEIKLNDAVSEPDIPEELEDIPIYFGGPVNTNQLILAVFEQGHTSKELTCKIESNFEQAAAYLSKENSWVRAFIGCSGWSAGQLEHELGMNTWNVYQPDPLLFEEKYTSKLWTAYFNGIDRWKALLPFIPKNPEMN